MGRRLCMENRLETRISTRVTTVVPTGLPVVEEVLGRGREYQRMESFTVVVDRSTGFPLVRSDKNRTYRLVYGPGNLNMKS